MDSGCGCLKSENRLSVPERFSIEYYILNIGLKVSFLEMNNPETQMDDGDTRKH